MTDTTLPVPLPPFEIPSPDCFREDGRPAYSCTLFVTTISKARAVLAQPEGLDAMALQMLVAAGHVTQGKVDEAFAILRMAESAPKETT